MVTRLILTSNIISPGTLTHISGMNFTPQQGGGGSSGANARSRVGTSSVHFEGNEQGQTPVNNLAKESNTRDLIGKSPV